MNTPLTYYQAQCPQTPKTPTFPEMKQGDKGTVITRLFFLFKAPDVAVEGRWGRNLGWSDRRVI